MKKRHILQFLQKYDCFLMVVQFLFFSPSSGWKVRLVQTAKGLSDLIKPEFGDQEELINLECSRATSGSFKGSFC